MKDKKHILLTFDYEPFLGSRTGTSQKCLIEPTDHLSKILSSYHAKAIFFVDTLYIQKLKECKALEKDYVRIKAQLVNLYKDGNYIYPHIHPHWIDAVYLNNAQFDLSNLTKYSLSILNQETKNNLFSQAINTLLDMGINYTEWGYRAGGWCIQPFNSLIEVFKKNNILYDFSVLPGFKNSSETQFFDYSDNAHLNPYYFFNNESEQNDHGSFIEFPISTIALSKTAIFADKLMKKYLWKIGDKGFGDGVSAKTAGAKTNFLNTEMISLDILNMSKMPLYKKFLKNNDYMHWISHPKMFTKHGLLMFDKFLKHAITNYDVDFDFVKMYPIKK